MKKTLIGLLASALLVTGSASCFASAPVKELAFDKVYSYQGTEPFEVKVWVQNDNKGTITYTGECYSNGKLDYRTVSVTKYTVYPQTDSSDVWGGQ